jgi:hypothetical protein
MAKRRLTDLYVVGKDLTFDDGSGEPVTVYLRKLNPVDQETAIKKANAARARVYATGRDPESDEYGELLSQAIDLGTTEDLISYLIQSRLVDFTMAKESELAADEGLREAWESGLQERYHIDPEDSEARHVFSELQRFADLVAPYVDDEREALEQTYDGKDLEELREIAAQQLVAISADIAWVREYRKSELWLATRVPDNHRERYFDSRDEVDELPAEIFNRLIEEFQSLNVGTTEGKDSRATDDSSVLSEPPEQEASSPSSGLVVVGQ